mgnify:CR=1 FL=1
MQTYFKYLGYAGLLPFISLPLLSFLGWLDHFRAVEYFVQYSAIILSFFGGVHWAQALDKNTVDHQVFVAMLPSIVAWLSVITLNGTWLLSTLALAYIAILMYDKYTLKLDQQMVVEYTLFRTILTTLVVFCHFVMSWL